MTAHVERLDAAAFASASSAVIDDDDDTHAWKNGATFCACDTTKDADGRLASTGDCSCFRYNGVRVDEHGDVKINVEEIPREPRVDAIEGIAATADFRWNKGRVVAWRFDGPCIHAPVLLKHDEDETQSIGVARCHLDSAGNLRTRIEFNRTARARETLARVKSGELSGLSPFLWHADDGSARLQHVTITATPRNAKAVITKVEARTDAAPLATIGGTITAIDRVYRTAHVVASTINEVDGEALTRWDLSRFAKNPVVLWSHLSDELPIGAATDVTFDPEIGLSMVITFASAAVNEDAAKIFEGVAAEIIRGVSVGYTMRGDIAELSEVSICNVPADEDALVSAKENDPMNMDAKRTTPGRKRTLRDHLRTRTGDRKIKKREVGELLARSTEGELRAMSGDKLRGLLDAARKRAASHTLAGRTDAAELRGDEREAIRDALARDAWKLGDVGAGFRSDAVSGYAEPNIDDLRARREARSRADGR